MEINKLKTLESFKKSENDGAGELLVHCGEVVSRSGIYEVIHPPHETMADSDMNAVVVIRGESIKPCPSCGDQVHLRLVYAAPHISEDGDFCPDQYSRS
jgi:hypothetical protein